MEAEKRMHATRRSIVLITVLCWITLLSFLASGQTQKAPELNLVPKEYQNKKMPKGWWTDPQVIEEGKKIFEGKVHPQVFCFACHGMNGKPLLPEARDMRDASYVDKMTEGYWYWRIAEGVPNTKMQALKTLLTEEEIWKVMAYSHTFSHGGKAEEHLHK